MTIEHVKDGKIMAESKDKNGNAEMAEFKSDNFITIRKNGSGTITISVPPERVREMAEALLVLTTDAKGDRAKSRVLIDAAVKEARLLLKQNKSLRDYLIDTIEALEQDE